MTSPTDPIRIFVNAKPVDTYPGETAIDAIARWDQTLGETIRAGQRAITDSRGIATPLDTPVFGGAIFRVVSARQAQDPRESSEDDPFAEA